MNSLVARIYTKKTLKRINEKNKLFGLSHNYNVDELLLSHLIISLFIFLILKLWNISFLTIPY